MADEEVNVASAVIIPEEARVPPQASPPPPASNGSLKRRQSSISSISSKRPRLSIDGATDSLTANSPPRDAPGRARPDRNSRKASLHVDSQEERQRGRRLFGGLLGTLAQSKTTPSQRKRAEVDKKQHEKLRVQAEEDEAVRKQKLEELQKKRTKEQLIWDEQSMKLRHENMRAMARCFKTSSAPPLYYKPAKTDPEDEERIKRQIEEVEDTIERELDEWHEKMRRVRQEAGEEDPQQDIVDREVSNQDDAESGNVINQTMDTEEPDPGRNDNDDHHMNGDTNEQEMEDASTKEVNGTTATQVEQDSIDQAVDDAGEVVEGDEDTVIY